MAKQYVTQQPLDPWRNKKGNTKYLETNENQDTMVQNLWDEAKAIIRGNFIVIQSDLKKQEIISDKQANLTSEAMKEGQTRLKVSRRKEIINIRAEINEIETKKTIPKINEIISFEKMKKNWLARLIKKKRETQINKIRNEKGEITTDSPEI